MTARDAIFYAGSSQMLNWKAKNTAFKINDLQEYAGLGKMNKINFYAALHNRDFVNKLLYPVEQTNSRYLI